MQLDGLGALLRHRQPKIEGMEIEFSVGALPGRVSVTCLPNDDPTALGCALTTPEVAHHYEGFPVCTATVDYEGKGYAALFGWTQLVKSTDNRSQGETFEMDPFSLYADIPTPFCWFGFNPTLFDAPARRERTPLQWLAHSFLCFTSAPGVKGVRTVLGFGWGFEITADGEISIYPVRRLESHEWNHHLDHLRTQYAQWSFLKGFHQT